MVNICEYGCNQEAKYTLKNGKKCCSEYHQCCPSRKEKLSEKIKLVHKKHKEKTGLSKFNKGELFSNNSLFDVGDSSKCYYCGEKANFILPNGRGCCSDKSNKCYVIRKKNSEGLIKAHKRNPEKWKHLGKTYGTASKKWREENKEKYEKIKLKYSFTMKEKYKSGELQGSFKGKKLSKEHKQKISNSMKECNNGFVNTKWFKVFSPYMNEKVTVQGNWEYKYALYLNENNISWIRTKKIKFQYKLFEEDYWHNYHPDFYLPEKDYYIEIKGYWWKSKDGRVDDKLKMEKVIFYNQDKKIIILQEKELKELGIDI